MNIEQHLVVSKNVVMMPARNEPVLTRRETEQLAHLLSEEIVDELVQDDLDYRTALACIEELAQLLLDEPGVDVADKVAQINNKLQPVLTYGAGSAKPLEVTGYPEVLYERALENILRITRALYTPGDEEWVATGVKLIQESLQVVLGHSK